MNWICERIYRKQKGFTLVELMVVIIILAVLTGIAIPSYMALRNRARDTAAKAELTNIATALELLMSDYSSYSATGLAAMTADLEGNSGSVNTNDYVYMSDVPQTDPWGTAYVYTTSSATTTYTLQSYGVDGSDGGGDDIEVVAGQPQWTD